MNETRRTIEFLFQLGSLRHIPRAWKQYYGIDVASDLEHTMRVIFIALALSRLCKEQTDELAIIKMALVHDIAESLTGDLTPIQKKYSSANEMLAISDTFADTVFSEVPELLARYRKKACLESRLVKDADNLDIDLELAELQEMGHQMVKKWQPGRRKLRDEKLYTEVARNFWDDIQKGKPSDWQDSILL